MQNYHKHLPATTNAVGEEIRRELLEVNPDLSRLVGAIRSHRILDDADVVRLVWKVVAEVNAALFPPITQMEIVHTEGCNLACTYCFEKEMLGYRRMPAEIGLAAVDLLFEYSREADDLSITHFGGEPTLNFAAIRSTTEYAEKRARSTGKQVSFNLTSNGTRLTEEMADYFARHRIMVLLSIDGLGPTHDRYRLDKRGRGTFESALAGMRLLKRFQEWIGVKMTVMPENAPDLLDDVIGLHELGVNQFVIGHATGVHWSSEAMQCYVREWARVLDWYRANKGDYLRISELDDLADSPSGPYFGCQAGRNSISISVNGEISPCSKILALDNSNLLAKLGDVRFGLTHIRNRAELNACTKLEANCTSDGIQGSFAGGCWASNYSDTGDLNKPSLQDHRLSVLQASACAGCAGRGPSGPEVGEC